MFFKFGRSQKVSIVAPSADLMTKLADHRLSLNPSENYYLEDWAVSSLEDWGPNDNWDAFEREELKKAHKSFVDSWVCLDHQNFDESLSIGRNVDAIYTPQHYVKVLMAVNKALSEQRLPGLQRQIEAGHITDTSMGAWCKYSVCSVCKNVASVPSEFCNHIQSPIRGTVVSGAATNWKEVRAFEINRGTIFFENSIITESEGADANAKILAKIASGGLGNFIPKSGPVFVPGDKLFFAIKKMASEASDQHEKMMFASFINRLSQLLDEGE